MTQRRLRLGDVLDDYCPRERRITNHAVVAMIDDTVKQTRCTTCDTEHEYKQAKVPAARRRKTGVPAAAQLVEGAVRSPEDSEIPEELPSLDDAPEMAETEETAETDDVLDVEEQTELVAAAPSTEGADAEAGEDEGEHSGDDRDEWPVHRPLIRAQLPRPEGHVPERKAPDFTIRQGGKFDPNRNGQRPRGHRPGGRQAQGQGQPGQGGTRFGGPRGQGGQGGPQGQRHGNRPGQGGGGGNRPPGPSRGPRPGGGRKRGR